MVANQGTGDMLASIYFMKKNILHEVEKPYAFRYAIDGVKQTNMEMEKMEGILISDIRGREHEYRMEDQGFEILKLDEESDYDSFFNAAGLSRYFKTLENLLKEKLKASEVRVFRHGVRKRHPEFPVSTGHSYAFDQPTSVAHIDTTPEEAANEVHRQYGADAARYMGKTRYQWINIWKPLKGPLNDWPLTVCSSATIAYNDLASADILYPDLATENYQVHYRQSQQWFYISGQKTSEVIVFKQSDSDDQACIGVPHCSFFNPHCPASEEPRESIEARALVFYD